MWQRERRGGRARETNVSDGVWNVISKFLQLEDLMETETETFLSYIWRSQGNRTEPPGLVGVSQLDGFYVPPGC